MGDNGTVESRTYTYSTSFNDGKVNNAVNLPLMNGTQFMVCMWVSTNIRASEVDHLIYAITGCQRYLWRMSSKPCHHGIA